MSGKGIGYSIAKILAFVLVIGLVAAAIGIVAYVLTQQQSPQDGAEFQQSLSGAFQRVRGIFGSRGRALGRPSPGVDLPSLADRLSAPAAQHIVTPSQEVVMTGMTPHTCLGADNEVMLEVQNDVGADQLDVSYAMENLIGNDRPADPVASRVVKVASCGKESVIKQCIPIPTSGKGVRLHTLAYYYEASNVREEPRVYPNIIEKFSENPVFKASEFIAA